MGGEQLSQVAGFALEPMDLLCQEQLQSNIRNLQVSHLYEEAAVTYFGWEMKQRKVRIPADGPALLECGWPDGIGIYRHGRGVGAKLTSWDTHESLCIGDHVPIKARVRFELHGQKVTRVVDSVV